MRTESEKKISLAAGAVLILSELLVWLSPKLGYAICKVPEQSWIYFLSAVFYLGFLFQIWKRGKHSYRKYLYLMFLTEAAYNVATFKLSSFFTLPFYAAVGIGMLWFLPKQENAGEAQKPGWKAKVGFGFLVIVAVLLTFVTIKMPPNQFLSESSIPKDVFQSLNSILSLDSDERIRYFLTDGVLSFDESFVVLTDRKIHIIKKSSGIPYTIIPFSDLAGVDAEISESVWDEDQVSLTTASGEVHQIHLYSPKAAKKQLVEKIRAMMSQVKSRI